MTIAKPVKCKGCLQFDDKERMVKEKEGYFHISECHSKYLMHKEFKRQETEKLDKICKYIVELHDLVSIPSQIVIRLQELRNGTIMQSGKKVKQYKNGISFDLIYDAYVLATDSIKWCIKNKLNDEKSTKALNYCFAVMQGKLNEAYRLQQQRKEQLKRQEVEIPKLYDQFEQTTGIGNKIKLAQIANTNDDEEVDITTLLD